MTIKCAIYTRKSSEEGLEQNFNSLDAQRISGESYIMSQAHEGWEIIEKHYDDGGYSGGNMDRPALKELLNDIESGLINCVVVYKIDRLSRSLLDFAKIVELFDKYKVSFVAVTQSFNTSNSMGRLMLNVLLSFAQYERELSGERVRDKIATSKKLGYWLGGYTPFGYDCVDKSLKINNVEAEIISYIFEKFLELKSITATLQDLKRAGIGTRSGNGYSKKTLRQLLENPIYKGYVSHKGTHYKGLHKGIIDESFFDEVQNIFSKNFDSEKTYEDSNALLKNIIKCGVCGCVMTPTHCYKNNNKYRYYTCSNHLRKKECTSENKNVPAGEVEEYVSKSICKILEDPIIVSQTLNKLDGTDLNESLKDMKGLWENLHFNERKKIVNMLITNVIVDNNGLNIYLNKECIGSFVNELTS
jgi:DNA invertase Pin-like site-specific DNA recombinase